MKKVLFLLLFLLILGAANVIAQIRLGGDEAPNAAAVLDLNADDLISDGTQGLALPRVSLASNNDKLGYSGLLEGMLVYNTHAGMTGGDGVGVYYWDGSEWVAVTSTKIADGSIGTAKLADNSVTRAKTTITSHVIPYSIPAAGGTVILNYPPGCTQYNTWSTHTGDRYAIYKHERTRILAYNVYGSAASTELHLFCF